MQRAQRNVPLYVAEARQREEQEQEKVLLLAEQPKDEQFLQQEQVRAMFSKLWKLTLDNRRSVKNICPS